MRTEDRPLQRRTGSILGSVVLGFALACAGGPGSGGVGAGSAPDEDALQEEIAELCSARVSTGPGEEVEQQRRLAMETWRLSTGGLSLDEATGNIARIHAEAQHDCFDQLLDALSGEGGADARAILQQARRSCENDGMPPASSALAQCIHARKLALFVGRGPGDAARERETLDRLLRVGGGAELSPEQRAAYCRTRELAGTGHPLCD